MTSLACGRRCSAHRCASGPLIQGRHSIHEINKDGDEHGTYAPCLFWQEFSWHPVSLFEGKNKLDINLKVNIMIEMDSFLWRPTYLSLVGLWWAGIKNSRPDNIV